MTSSLRYFCLAAIATSLSIPTMSSAQDVLVVGINTNSSANDQFSFVASNAIPGGTVFYFTDEEYSDATGQFVAFTEGLTAYTAPGGGLAKGEVVLIEESAVPDALETLQCSSGSGATCGSATFSGSFSIGQSDEFYAFSASNSASPLTTVTAVHSYFTWQVTPSADADPTTDYPSVRKLAFANPGLAQLKEEFLHDNGGGVRVNTTGAEYELGANWTRTLDSATDLVVTAFTNLLLPVELVSFDARLQDDDVVLTWVTAAELNNAGFEIEHRIGDVFESVAFVDGAGTTQEARTYVHRIDNIKSGTHVFRLRQIDFDGAFEYSPEVEVTAELPELFVLKSAYPNPFNPVTNIEFAVSVEQVVSVKLYSQSGQLVRTLFGGTVPAHETQLLRLDGSGLATGQYIVRLTGSQFAATEQVTLLK